ncbi:MAG TPA: hypothetical protein VKF14_20665 [Candidatus Dormibacteraeota bacterium]|nr:hypothetical protein [Candidatus Dormibacteraeota bacterium]
MGGGEVTDNPPPPHSQLARLVWRHRWELIPVWAGLGALIFATMAHAVARNAWPLALALGAAATAAWRWRAGQKRAQAYAVAVGATATLWFTAAWWASPWHPSLIVILALGVLAVGIPRWRRRDSPRDTGAAAPDGRAIVRDLRELALEWPARSAAAELVGSSIQHAEADEHGYTLTLALRPGQTIADVVSSLSRLESALKAPPGAVHVAPDPDRADRCLIRVVHNDPLAMAVRWRVPSGQSIADPIHLGAFRGGDPVEVALFGEHMLVAGAAGRGKSGMMNVVTAELAARRDVVMWGIDCRDGLELAPWQVVLDRWAVSADEGTAVLRAANRIVDARARLLAAHRERRWRPAPEEPALVVLVDELSELTSEAIGLCERLARRGRPLGIGLVAATHHASAAGILGGVDLRHQVAVRVCLGLVESHDVDRILGPGRWGGGWCAERLRLPGSFLIVVPGMHETPRPARAFWLSDEDVAHVAARFGTQRPALDAASAAAAGEVPVPSRLVVER